MKDTVAENQMSERIGCNHAAVMRIGHVNSPKQFLACVCPAVSICIGHQKEPRLCGNNHPALVKRHAVQGVEPTRENSAFVCLSITVDILEHEDLVIRQLARNRVGK